MEPIAVPLLSSPPFASICASIETLHDLGLLPNRGEIKGTYRLPNSAGALGPPLVFQVVLSYVHTVRKGS